MEKCVEENYKKIILIASLEKLKKNYQRCKKELIVANLVQSLQDRLPKSVDHYYYLLQPYLMGRLAMPGSRPEQIVP